MSDSDEADETAALAEIERAQREQGCADDERVSVCLRCGRPLDRVDHYGIEHLVLRGDVYVPATLDDDGAYCFASEVDLRCGRCSAPLPRKDREYFYRRWYQVLAASGDGT